MYVKAVNFELYSLLALFTNVCTLFTCQHFHYVGRPHGITEDYVNIVGELMYPKQPVGPYGFDSENGRVRIRCYVALLTTLVTFVDELQQFPADRMNTLGWLLCPLRKPTVIGET